MEEIINYGRKKIRLRVKREGFFSRFIGLMFSNRESDNLLFEFNKSVRIPLHSFFVFFSFLVIWLDSSNRVLDFKIVKPFYFSVLPCGGVRFNKVIEIPINDKNAEVIGKLGMSTLSP